MQVNPGGPRGLLIAAPSSGAGKTTVTLALLRAFKNAGLSVVSAKSGPDYIDPKFHEAASGTPCLNLDAWAMDVRAPCERWRVPTLVDTIF
jgi:cobyrinic acid a,c-diamide synthase